MGLGFRTNITYVQLETQQKTVTPYAQGRDILPDAGYDAMTRVTLNNIPKTVVNNTYGQTVYIGKEPTV